MARRPLVPQNVPLSMLQPVPAQSRIKRTPSHQFHARTRLWNIQPIAIAPVLPGESLENARIQARVVSDPLDSKLKGMWTELHLFYVKHRDTSQSAALQAMVLDPLAATGLPTVSGGGGATYHLHGRPDFTALALEAVTNWFFRDEGEVSADFTDSLTGLPLAKLGRQDWLQSLVQTATLTAVDVDVDINNDTNIMASEVETAMQHYEWLRNNQLVDMTYEDFLATYGVRTRRAEVLKPELLRSIKDWTFPTNTVTQGTGAVTSACVWSLNETVTKKRFFVEPGWLLLVSVTRPKVFRSQPGSATDLMTDAYTWLPAVLRDDPYTSLVAMDTVRGGIPHVSQSGGLWTVDIRDLFLHGDQFQYVAPTVAGGDTVAASTAWSTPAGSAAAGVTPFNNPSPSNGRGDYPFGTLGESNSFFTGTTAATNCIEIEGIVRFEIAGMVTEGLTPGVPVRS